MFNSPINSPLSTKRNIHNHRRADSKVSSARNEICRITTEQISLVLISISYEPTFEILCVKALRLLMCTVTHCNTPQHVVNVCAKTPRLLMSTVTLQNAATYCKTGAQVADIDDW